MKKIIRTNNLQKALEDYDALKGQAVSYVSELPVSPNIRNSVYCKQTTTDVEDSLNITVESLIQDYAEETETADHYVIPVTYTVEYLGIAVRAIEVSGDAAIMYEDEDFTTALAASFNLEDKYLFAVTTHVTEMAYYMGDAANQVLHPVVSFGVIAEVNKRIDVVERELDAKIDSNYDLLDNKIDNEISNLAVNFTTNNLVANVATINNASIDTAQVNNFDVSSIIANGSTGSDGQVLGKVNGNVEWFSPSLDTNDFKVNHLTVNESESVNGDNFKHKGFDVTSMTVISEDEYNNLSLSARGSAFYMTTPNGNMYFHGVKFAPQGMVHEYVANVNLPRMASNNSTLTTSTLTFTKSAVTNNFVNGGAYTGIKNITAFGESWDNSAPVGTQANDGNIITNATQGLYITNASGMFSNCTNMTDCFFTNPALVVNAPENYDPMKYCKDMSYAFSRCYNFNQPVTIPNSVRDMSYAFEYCYNFDQPITIPNDCNAVGALSATNFTQNLYVPNSANVTKLFNYIRNIEMDTLTFEGGFKGFNVTEVGFGERKGKTSACSNIVVSGDSVIGFGIPLYSHTVSNLVNGNPVNVISDGHYEIGMICENDIYLNCNIVGIGADDDDEPYYGIPIAAELGSARNVHILSKYSVNTTNAPVDIEGSFQSNCLFFGVTTYNNEQVNSIITQYLTSGWDFSGNVYDSDHDRNVHVDIHLGIGYNFTGHIINDL